MSAEPDAAALTLALICGLAAGALPAYAAEEPPDMAFLEYLGSWEGSDEDWVLLAADEEPVANDEDTRGDPAPQTRGSQESDNES